MSAVELGRRILEESYKVLNTEQFSIDEAVTMTYSDILGMLRKVDEGFVAFK